MITPAHNEAVFLPQLIASVRAQTRPPDHWFVIDDASSDDTPQLLRETSVSLPYLEVITRAAPTQRSFGAKVDAVMVGWDRACRAGIDLVACVDADVVLPPDFFARVLAAFDADPALGVTGARYEQWVAGQREGDGGPPEHVPGAAQVFRREVFEAIGGYLRLADGGEDTVANVAARAFGWQTRTVEGLVVEHLRAEGSVNWSSQLGRLAGRGRRDYDVGNVPLFELAKVVRRAGERPRVVGSVVRLASYTACYLRRRPRPVAPAVVTQLRLEQRRALRDLAAPRRSRR